MIDKKEKHNNKEQRNGAHKTLGKKKYKTVLVNMVTKHLPNGFSTLSSCKPRVYDIVKTYMDGRIGTAGGDVWRVKPYDGSEADYIIDEGGRG